MNRNPAHDLTAHWWTVNNPSASPAERSRAVRIVIMGTCCGLALGAGVAAVAAAVWDHLADWLHRR